MQYILLPDAVRFCPVPFFWKRGSVQHKGDLAVFGFCSSQCLLVGVAKGGIHQSCLAFSAFFKLNTPLVVVHGLAFGELQQGLIGESEVSGAFAALQFSFKVHIFALFPVAVGGMELAVAENGRGELFGQRAALFLSCQQDPEALSVGGGDGSLDIKLRHTQHHILGPIQEAGT